MFKIRSPQLNDLLKLKDLIKGNSRLEVFYTKSLNKFSCLAQPLIPHNLRYLPSIHIAVEENNILGFIILKSISKPNNCWQIDEVFVLDENRNKGIGEELVRYVLSVYGSHGVEHFFAEVDSQNFPALSLFHQCGFRRYAKVCLYKSEVDIEAIYKMPQLEKDFVIRPQLNYDLNEIEKLDLASIPPELRPALGRGKEYFKNKKNSIVLIDKSRNLIIGWAQLEKPSNNNSFIELLVSPGWTHLYEQFLNTIISLIATGKNKLTVTIKSIDYITELKETLIKSGYLQTEVKEFLVRTIWQKVKERKTKTAKFAVPRIAPT